MVLGRLAHWGSTVLLTSAVLAGVKRSTGFGVSTAALPEGVARTTADQVLGAGERVFDYAASLSYHSQYFERDGKVNK